MPAAEIFRADCGGERPMGQTPVANVSRMSFSLSTLFWWTTISALTAAIGAYHHKAGLIFAFYGCIPLCVVAHMRNRHHISGRSFGWNKAKMAWVYTVLAEIAIATLFALAELYMHYVFDVPFFFVLKQ